MKVTSIASAGLAVLGIVNAAAVPARSDDAVKRDSTVENLDNPAWWGKKRDSDVETLDNPAWWGKKRDSDVENPGSVFSPTGTPAAPTTTYFVPALPTTPLPNPTTGHP